jgi:hypothetical protein
LIIEVCPLVPSPGALRAKHRGAEEERRTVG